MTFGCLTACVGGKEKMGAIRQYLDELKMRLLLSIIVSYRITIGGVNLNDRIIFEHVSHVSERRLSGSIREYFILLNGRCVTLEYRYQWMNGSQQQLIKRWDNARHFPNLPNFPHHIHDHSETHVIPGNPLSIIELMTAIESELL